MDLIRVLKTIQLVIALTITFFVLIQSKGQGLSSAFGGMAGQYRTKRGVEKLLFNLTIVTGILFVVNSLLIIVLG